MNGATVFQLQRLNVKFATGFALLLGCVFGLISGFIVDALAWTVFAVAVFLGAYSMWDAAYEVNRKIIVSDLGLTLYNPMRFWGPRQEFGWGDIKQLELRVQDEKRTLRFKADKPPRFYYEDVFFSAELAAAIVDFAKLQPVKGEEAPVFSSLPVEGKFVYRWAKK